MAQQVLCNLVIRFVCNLIFCHPSTFHPEEGTLASSLYLRQSNASFVLAALSSILMLIFLCPQLAFSLT